MDLGLDGRVCVVTGASRGIGFETARLLCAEGASVVLLARDAPQLESAVAKCAEAGGAAAGLPLDITAADAAERIRDFALERFGPVDVLVNNAGTSVARPLAKLEDADWQAQWLLHVMAPMRLMRELAPAMAERRWGRIVNVTSSSGKRPSAMNVAYSVTKAAQLSLSRAFADLYAPLGVLVNAVAPGPVATPLWMAPGGLADQVGETEGISREEAIGTRRAKVPLGRFGEAPEIAGVIAFLCSELASNVVGAAWSVDGGAVPVII
jgi:NAD(P)-dependent dehydrogenase (short-subunit alcohol dehydrogenase family)